MNNINHQLTSGARTAPSMTLLRLSFFGVTAHKGLALLAGLLVSATALAAAPALATKPLTVAGGVVKPNLMFVMDTSLSMISDLTNDTLLDAGQCKAATKLVNGHPISGLTVGPTAANPTNPNTRLTIYTPNVSSYGTGNGVYLTVPGKPEFSGAYQIHRRNTPGATCTAFNTSVIVNPPIKVGEAAAGINNPTRFNQTAFNPGNPSADPPIPPTNGCSVTTATPANNGSTTTTLNLGGGFVVNASGVTTTPSASCFWRDLADTNGCSVTMAAPANSGSTTTTLNLGGGFVVNAGGVTTTPSTSCFWRDPLDNAIGTVCQNWAGTGEDSVEVNIATATAGALTAADILDARILHRQDVSWCDSEPPLRSAKVQTLFYDPSVSYRPPPWPRKVGQGLKAPLDAHLSNLNANSASHNLLPNMDRAYTSAWRFVRQDGTRLNASGDPDTSAANTWGGATGSTASVGLSSASNGMGFNRWREMVYCDTPNRPTGFANDRAWMDSNRCVKNAPGANSVLRSPNYPYLHPARVGGGTTPSRTLVTTTALFAHQNGQSVGSKNPTFDFAGGRYYAFGEHYNFAFPHYYNITPIEYCTSSKLNDCRLGAPSGAYTVPAYVRYCKTEAEASDTSISPGAASCQAGYTGNAAADYRFARYGLFEKVEIRPDVTSYPKGSNRRDCAGSTCTYDEEMTNIANWYAYYRTRIQLMKTASGRTFDTLNADNDADADFRVGLITVEGYNTPGNYLPIRDFKGGVNEQKEQWFRTVYSRVPSGGTSLRDVLGTVGRIYSGRNPVSGFGSEDPVQYSCQQNFTLLTTDGYWNGAAGLNVSGGAIPNQDASPTPLPFREGSVVLPGGSHANTLADVAMYYYDTDLRDPTLSNCTGAFGSDVCLNDVLASGDDTNKKQHMTTFTLGLGVDGLLNYSPTYKTDTSGDFHNLRNGLAGVQWPSPGPDNGNGTLTPAERATIDDLWHAAVNGRGTYFSARNPDELIGGISGTLISLGDAPGTGSTTALSSNAVTTTEYAYSARYTTGKWTGNLFARTINANGALSANAVWCVENEGSVTPPCTGSLSAKVASTTDTRNIKMNNGVGGLVDFNVGSISGAGKIGYFNQTYLQQLTQWEDSDYSSYQKTRLNENTFVSYLRGQHGFDKRNLNDLGGGTDNRLYRERSAVLGDIVDSDPTFVGAPAFDFEDPGYLGTGSPPTGGFKGHAYSNLRTIYVGANDGMLHAFNADTGEERWAFVPTAVMPNLWKLADKNYANKHTNYVNGEITVADVFIAGNWETILVGGLGQGGRSYYAIKITDPNNPVLLWEIDSSTAGFSNLGYSYGKPIVTKLKDGTWVVVLTSGYNNTSPGSGTGHLFVLDALSGGTLVKKDIPTGVGSVTTPSGLAQVTGFANKPTVDNTALYVYGGDLLGNLYRFDINAGSVTRLTTLRNSTGDLQPITTQPTTSVIEGKRVVYVGTGKLIEPEDLLPVNYRTQTIYAIKDDDIATPIADIRANSVQQTLSTLGTTRTASNHEVDWSDVRGWFVDLDSGERQNVSSAIIGGVLVVPTMVPPAGLCDMSGRGWINVFDFKTGGAVDPAFSFIVSTQTLSPIAGLYYTYSIPAPGSPVVVTIDADFTRASVRNNDCDISNPNCNQVTIPAAGQFVGIRAIWRELIPE